jgi:hypothetical protein
MLYQNLLKSHFLDHCVFLAVLLITFAVFGLNSQQLGFYADDASWLAAPEHLTLSSLVEEIEAYVTGRNLHVLWQYIVYSLLGKSLSNLGLHHLLMAFITGLNAALVYGLLRLFGFTYLVAFITSMLFAFYPNHAEVQYWLTALPQNLISTSLVLLLLIFSLIVIRMIGASQYKRLGVLLFMTFIIYICALFTYDQVVPVIVATVFLIGLIGSLDTQIRAKAILFLIICLMPLPALVIWKMNIPGGGPVMSNINISHIGHNFRESLSNNFGDYLQIPLGILLDNASHEQEIAALTFVMVICLVAMALCLYQFSSYGYSFHKRLSQYTWGPYIFSGWIKWPMWIFFAISIYILAYLPAYIWYIAPRHNYLPGIGVALGLAIVMSAPLEISRRILGRWGWLFAAIAVILFSAKYNYQFIKADLVEKLVWANSFQSRINLYSKLEQDGRLKGISTLILGEFPSVTPFGTAPFGYQPNTEVELITNGRIKVTNLDRVIQPGISGLYIYTSAISDGLDAFRFAPWDHVLILKYHHFVGDKIGYEIIEPYSLRPRYKLSGGTALKGLIQFSAVKDATGLKLSIPSLQLRKGEVLTALPLHFTGGKKSPLPFINANSGPTSFLIEIPNRYIGREVYVQLPSGMPEVGEVGLYISSEVSQSRLLDQVKVIQSNR